MHPHTHNTPSSRARTPLPHLQLSPVMGPNPTPSGNPLGGGQRLFMGPGQNVPYRPPYGAPPYPPYPPFQRQPFPHPPFPHQEAFQHQAFPQEPFPHPPLQHPPTYQSPFQYPPTQCLPVQYGPYPMGALPDPVPHQVTTHQSQQGLPAHDFNATVGMAPPVHAEQKVKGRQTGRAKWGATAVLTESDHPTQNYRNPWVRNGVWEFEVVVTENQVKRIFNGRTDMGWYSFSDMACDHLSQPHDQVVLGYKLTGDTGGMTELTCEPQWKKAMVRMRERIIASRMCAVTMELKNLITHLFAAHDRKRDQGAHQGKEKRTQDGDVPPELSSEKKHQQECLIELRHHLLCARHSRPGCQTYCWPKPATQGKMGGHRELSHEEMSLWAKHISEGKATKYLPPKTMKFKHPTTKKPKSGPAPPENCQDYPEAHTWESRAKKDIEEEEAVRALVAAEDDSYLAYDEACKVRQFILAGRLLQDG
ncbi:hypothetical protein EI94DRAFT_1696663 [Lactarius quietus]|nr:hypothetical protein EI94DRAFT_1696663 [Lactarius quietus]